MKIRNNKIRFGAFTLLELLVAIALMDVIAVTLYSSMYAAFKSKKTSQRVLKPFQVVTPAFEIIRNDLVSTMTPDGILAGVFMGENASGGEQGLDADTLDFFTCSYQPELDEITSNVINVGYGLANDSFRDQIVLKRYIQKNILSPNAIDPEEEIICRNIIGMDIMYYDGEAWVEDWDSSVEDSQLPWAVKITLTIVDTENTLSSIDGLREFTRIFMLPTCNQEMTEASEEDETGGMP